MKRFSPPFPFWLITLLLLIPWSGLQADCGCPNPEVKMEMSYPDQQGLTLYVDGVEQRSDSPPLKMKEDQEYEITLQATNGEGYFYAPCDSDPIVYFPHCRMEYSTDGGGANGTWKKGKQVEIKLIYGPDNTTVTDFNPRSVFIRVTDAASDDGDSGGGGGGGASVETSVPQYVKQEGATTPTVQPTGVSLKIPMGSILMPEGYRSAGKLTIAGPISASSSATASLEYSAISAVNSLIAKPTVANGQGVVLEKLYVTPQGVYRVTGWNSTTQTATNWEGGAESLIRVYDPSQYNSSTQSFTGEPRNWYRIESVTNVSSFIGVRLVQSLNGMVETRTFLSSLNGLTSREMVGTMVTEQQVVPPATGSTSWQRQTTVTKDGIETSSVLEEFSLINNQYFPTMKTVDPSSAVGDELVTQTSYYGDGQIRSVVNPDGSWQFYQYSGSSTITYSPWLSSANLVYSGGVWSLPTAGKVLKKSGYTTGSGYSQSSYLVDLSIQYDMGVKMSGSSSYTSEEPTYTRSSNGVDRTNSVSINSYSLSYSGDYSDQFLAGRLLMTWDQSSSATLYGYEKLTLNGETIIKSSRTKGYIASPNAGSNPADFTNVPLHSTKEVTIKGPLGILREETYVCNASGSYVLAVAKDHEYETSGLRRHIGVKINGNYISRTQYVSLFITRNWNEEGGMTEMEINSEGELIRQTTFGNGDVPAVISTFSKVGLTSTTTLDGKVMFLEMTDKADRVISTQDSIGAVTTTTYADGGRTVTRVGPGGVTNIQSRHLDGQLISTTGTAVVPVFYSYAIDPSTNLPSVTTRIGGVNSDRRKTVVNYLDGSTAIERSPDPTGGNTDISRTYQYASTSNALLAIISSAANTTRQISNDPSISAAAAMGHYTLSGQESDSNGPVISSSDRLTETAKDLFTSGGVWYWRTMVRKFHTNSTTAAYTQTTLEALSPQQITHPEYGPGMRWVTNVSQATRTITRNRDVFFAKSISLQTSDDSATTASPDSQVVNFHGRPVSSSAYGTTGPETMAYDSSGRLIRKVSATGGVTRYTYNSLGQLESTSDHFGKITSYQYYPATHTNAGLSWKVTNPELEVTESLYNNLGQLVETKGNGNSRITYGYNVYGEMNSMRTYPTAASPGDLTQWTYSPATGLLLEKIDAANQKVVYTYYSNGLLNTRKWARNLTTTYSYNAFGDLTLTDYPTGTTDVSVTPDRLGRPASITDASGTRSYTYDSVTGLTDLITYGASGLLASRQLDYTFDSFSRPSGYSVAASGPSSVWAYDGEGRLKTVTSAGSTHTHQYLPGTSMLAGLSTVNGATTVLNRTLYHDRMGRLTGIVTANAFGSDLSRHGYQLDTVGRRTRATRENGQRWDYDYDDKGQVISGIKKFPDATAIPGHTFSFTYDEIGNRISTVHGGTDTGVTYTANALNQYGSVTTQNGRFLMGEAPVANAVTINGSTATREGGLGFYWKKLNATNTSAPAWSNDSIVSNGVTISGRTWTPKNVVNPTYDLDGNLTSDGKWDYTWDAENRLVSMQTAAIAYASAVGVPRQMLDYTYDSQGRRVAKTVYTTTNLTSTPTWTFVSSQRFLYDEWNLIAEYSSTTATGTTLTLQATHSWGVDLSGSQQGAGGVGGLLASHLLNPAATAYPAYDGNGNISAWIDTAGAVLGRKDYSPFGQLVANYKLTGVGTTLPRLAFGFSTKYTDAESGLPYYGYRYYDPVAGRWTSKDPIEEQGGVNLFGFVGNDGINLIDVLGRQENYIPTHEERIAMNREKWKKQKEAGLKGFEKLEKKLVGICENYAMKDIENEEKDCKEEARKLAAKIIDTWSKNCGRGNNPSESSVGGYLCYEWAENFVKIPKGLKLKKWAAKLEGAEADNSSYEHYWAAFAICGNGSLAQRTLQIDDGILSTGNIHDVNNPLPGDGWKKYKNPQPPTPGTGVRADQIPMIW